MLATYPPELPDCAFASLAHQLHMMSSDPSSERSIREIFGKDTNTSSAFSRGLLALAARLPTEMGLSVEILLHRFTAYPYVRPFILKEVEKQFIESLFPKNGKEAAHAKKYFSKQKNNLSRYEMRFCPDCVKLDTEKYGIPYWHTSHQIHEITVCHIHKLELRTTCHECGPLTWNRTLLTLPGACRKCRLNLCTKNLNETPVLTSSPAFRIAVLINEIIAAHLPPFDWKYLKQCYLIRLAEIGISVNGKTSHSDLAKLLIVNFGASFLNELGASVTDKAFNTSWTSHLLTRAAPATKPIYHCLLILVLFGTMEKLGIPDHRDRPFRYRDRSFRLNVTGHSGLS
jgi:hypothetical protein